MKYQSATQNEFITLASYPRAIVHIDCDAFFTSCETARSPAFKNKPLVTGQERGIVSCPSYEAKARGVVRGMRIGEAKKICPGVIVLPSDYELYSIYSYRMFDILRRFTPQVEEYSIDEAFCDLTGLRRIYRNSYAALARHIKGIIQQELGITVSVGLSLTRILAKICSKQNKPDGFCAVPGKRLHEFLQEIPLEKVCGFGKNTVALLHNTVYDYVCRPRESAQKLLGKIGVELWQELRGDPVYPVMPGRKGTYLSLSKTKTFMPSSRDREFVRAQLMRNLESACIKLRRHRLCARVLTVYLRKTDFSGGAFEARLSRYSSATLEFTPVCARLFKKAFDPTQTYRASGVILSDIVSEERDSRTLFDDPVRVERIRTLSKVTDEMNALYGKHTLHIAAAHLVNKKGPHTRNRLAWRKKELLRGETFRKRLGIPLLKVR